MNARKTLLGQASAEFLGTLVLIALGDGVVGMVTLFERGVPGAVCKGGYPIISLGWGLAVLMGICVAGRDRGSVRRRPCTPAVRAGELRDRAGRERDGYASEVCASPRLGSKANALVAAALASGKASRGGRTAYSQSPASA